MAKAVKSELYKRVEIAELSKICYLIKAPGLTEVQRTRLHEIGDSLNREGHDDRDVEMAIRAHRTFCEDKTQLS